jgi:hypothetical protein
VSEIRVGNPGQKSKSGIWVRNPGEKSGLEKPGEKSGSDAGRKSGSEIRVWKIQVGNPGQKSGFGNPGRKSGNPGQKSEIEIRVRNPDPGRKCMPVGNSGEDLN